LYTKIRLAIGQPGGKGGEKKKREWGGRVRFVNTKSVFAGDRFQPVLWREGTGPIRQTRMEYLLDGGCGMVTRTGKSTPAAAITTTQQTKQKKEEKGVAFLRGTARPPRSKPISVKTAAKKCKAN